ncbi:hypothetical protein Kpol_1018p36 [Vanderwaltozyma polyspora DSM 70294]|uniref:malate dehydrogenase (oxaloacetate-decarboxylating) n=1 Tax=Vanderwaltozyma polyspora (strain ATCC 22028 / DSM 70294 / BCRC 21397 / CBS 2163 / NBRC 10782 / NRRL Y-8283 / UCD 57-17) TaxID=436907 RepID=A7TDN7_VANPO|nr:uncharacterized protein Kpol_1018p36 [Vanderwaltozyma polyspora DSM 70294]EDO19507.1 hypothetical protein Kpol_1018p36 [Vanderwaltozyma polyspora DSM 70294]
MLSSNSTLMMKRIKFKNIRCFNSITNKNNASTLRDSKFNHTHNQDQSKDFTNLGSKPKSIFDESNNYLQNEKNKKSSSPNLLVNGPIECNLTGINLLNSPLFNKGTAFTEEEREKFEISGLLPPQVNTLDDQLDRTYKQLQKLSSPIEKNDFMTTLRTENSVLYYAMIKKHVRELIPIVYTPTEGDAISSYSHRLRKSEGLFLDITDPDSIDKRLANYGNAEDLDYIVVSDSEGILGIGDQGVGGVRIAISKLALMTLCGGVHPGRVLPICLDVGTNNKELARDELYTGNRFSRVRGKEYDNFVDKFIRAVKKRFPKAILHFEDFGVTNARRLLERYRNELPCFNDDIQGTGAVVMASLSAALKHTKRDLKDAKIIIYGAGSAGVGIADQIVNHMCTHGLSIDEARSKIYLINRNGLILKSHYDSLYEAQRKFVKLDEDWEGVDTKQLLNIVNKVKPTCLIGCSTQAGAFSEQIVKEMHKYNSRPIIFPLSNPTRLHEAVPEDLMKWTNNDALVATGSPFKPVNGYRISENNNCFSFPGIGLGSMLARATVISDTMISAAVDELASLSPLEENDSKPGLLPPLESITETSARVATAVLLQSIKEGSARIELEGTEIPRDFDDCLEWVKSQMWKPVYRDMVRV